MGQFPVYGPALSVDKMLTLPEIVLTFFQQPPPCLLVCHQLRLKDFSFCS